jgi:hypothetical protein
MDVYVYINPNNGRAKLWAYTAEPGGDEISFGSCFAGGHQVQSKSRGYGRTTASEKTSGGGYIACGSFTSTTSTFKGAIDAFFSDMRTAKNGATVNAFSDRSQVLKSALRAANENTAANRVTPTGSTAPPPTPKPVAAKKVRAKIIASVVTKGTEPSKYEDW